MQKLVADFEKILAVDRKKNNDKIVVRYFMRILSTVIFMTLIGCSAQAMQKTVGDLTIDFTGAEKVSSYDTIRAQWPNGSQLVINFEKASGTPFGHYSDHSNQDFPIIFDKQKAQQWLDIVKAWRPPSKG
jgi:hypothetical protein